MQLIAPDILIEARGLSLSVCLFFFITGILLWFFGWRHRRRLQKVVNDLSEADKAVDTYRPLAELERVLGGGSLDDVAQSSQALPAEENTDRERPTQPGGRQRS